MDIDSEIKQYYSDSLITYTNEQLDHLLIEQSTAHFLRTIGLPALITDGTELRIAVIDQFSQLQPELPHFFMFGTSEFGNFACDRQSGSIYLVTEDHNIHFVNTNIYHLLLFCALFYRIHVARPYITESERIYRQRATELRKAFRQYDPLAVKESIVWSIKMEEVGNGVI